MRTMTAKKKKPNRKTFKGQLAAHLRELRESHGWSVPDLVEKLSEQGIEVKRQTLYSWEIGHRQPTLAVVEALAAIYKTSPRLILPE